ncbi:hypothetical protein [Caulobacter sp. 17J65-9]|uniref:hypothetical protein n=1 Tax=Caulobacter sp. 17J65-9 TaxID=2709382 RepID=UPI0013CA1D04|nr:hypothetical protein [Caulobacter sp. 17J65-9]NEX91329.1 hypothetical protein [Caulobacter sp. 17J65-9]
MKKTTVMVAAVLGASAMLSGCGHTLEQRAATGALGGAAVGAVLGGGIIPGAVVGGIGGFLVHQCKKSGDC